MFETEHVVASSGRGVNLSANDLQYRGLCFVPVLEGEHSRYMLPW
jgi:hypothetical protein